MESDTLGFGHSESPLSSRVEISTRRICAANQGAHSKPCVEG